MQELKQRAGAMSAAEARTLLVHAFSTLSDSGAQQRTAEQKVRHRAGEHARLCPCARPSLTVLCRAASSTQPVRCVGDHALQAAQLEARLAQQQEQLQEAEASVQLKDVEYERRLAELQREHARAVQALLRQVRPMLLAGQQQPERQAQAQDQGPPDVLSGIGHTRLLAAAATLAQQAGAGARGAGVSSSVPAAQQEAAAVQLPVAGAAHAAASDEHPRQRQADVSTGIEQQFRGLQTTKSSGSLSRLGSARAAASVNRQAGASSRGQMVGSRQQPPVAAAGAEGQGGQACSRRDSACMSDDQQPDGRRAHAERWRTSASEAKQQHKPGVAAAAHEWRTGSSSSAAPRQPMGLVGFARFGEAMRSSGGGGSVGFKQGRAPAAAGALGGRRGDGQQDVSDSAASISSVSSGRGGGERGGAGVKGSERAGHKGMSRQEFVAALGSVRE